MKKLLLVAVAALCLAACGNSNANKEGAQTKAAHECTECTKAAAQAAEHKCEGCKKNAADSTKHECNKPADQQCAKCKEAAAKKAAEQAK